MHVTSLRLAVGKESNGTGQHYKTWRIPHSTWQMKDYWIFSQPFIRNPKPALNISPK
jgi:hypothetical protein